MAQKIHSALIGIVSIEYNCLLNRERWKEIREKEGEKEKRGYQFPFFYFFFFSSISGP
jgi:hypothetical protein